ncbi:MAG TPA: hypothetical protein VF668_01925 [Pyrinomonadaceae bacterium]|jgi:hypothetical protein
MEDHTSPLPDDNREVSGTGDEGGGDSSDEAEELRAEDESAKAMEAEVPHSEGYDDPGQEPPAGS